MGQWPLGPLDGDDFGLEGLGLIVLDGGLDGVLGQHGAVQLDRRQL